MINQLVRRARKIFKKTVSATDVRNHFYYNRIYFKRILLFFKAIDDCGKKENAKRTETGISPLGLKFGSSVNQVEKEMGNAKYSYDNENDTNNHRVLFYRRSFTDTSLLVQLQFYNNQLFFIGLDVIRRLIDENEKIEVINTVIQKYLNQPFKKGEAYPLIQDRSKNSIVINDDMNFSICYIGGDVTIEKQKNIIKAMENVLVEKPEKGSMFYAF
ncbi:MAG: hypothetical protein LH478_10615 [Chitinophagaceae bacterium]|nr:hypothetical protein [Chitinophagaceae bacterium]